MSTTPKLTKKQQKAQQHRIRKGKGAAVDDEPNDIPEQDILDENGEAVQQDDKDKVKVKQSNRKRKRDDEDEDAEGKDGIEDGQAAPTKAKKKRKNSKQRFIVFVGNLPYKVTSEDVVAHFSEACGEAPSVRLLTPKEDSTRKTPSKGCAFLEFTTSTALQNALHLHESTFKSSLSSSKRKINVELTTGGGGNSEGRKSKLAEVKGRLAKQRDNKREVWEEEKKRKDEEKAKVREEWRKQLREKEEKDKGLPPLKRQKKKSLPKFLTGPNSAKLG